MTEISFNDARKILGLAPEYSKEELKTQYRTLAKKYHPDHGGDVKKFKRIQRAYEKLSNMTLTDRDARNIEDRIFDDLFEGWKNGKSN